MLLLLAESTMVMTGVEGWMGWRLRDSGESEGAWVEVWALLWSRVTIELSRAWVIAEHRGKKQIGAEWARLTSSSSLLCSFVFFFYFIL